MNYPQSIVQFPITPFLDQICDTLKKSKTKSLVLTAETGAGKSTVLPTGLLSNFEGKIIMTEPRRLAVLGVAERVSSLLGEECGQTAGYKIHLESKLSSKTRFEVMTEAVLVRMLQEDPALEGINLVVLDEFHERGINVDLALAFLKEALELRDDLFVIVMSATMDTERISQYLGGAPVVSVPGRTFPVEIKYAGKEDVVSAVEKEVLSLTCKKNEKGQTILVFLPGITEIRRCADDLTRRFSGNTSVLVKVLHSSVKIEDQREVLLPAPDGICRIVVSSAIAETSLTIPDVAVVVDSGLSRLNRINLSTGMNQLVTQVESDFSATQRAGRAGRVKAGKCVRLWNQNESRAGEIPGEILRTDLTQLVLECSERGIFSPDKIDWLDKPSCVSWNASAELLKKLGFVSEQGRITEKGKAALKLGIDPRLGGIALNGEALERLGVKTDFLEQVVKYSQYGQSGSSVQKQFCQDLKRRLEKAFLGKEKELTAEKAGFVSEKGLLFLAGYPDRIARRVSELGIEPAEYQFCTGRKAVLYSKLAPEWICAPEVNATDKGGVIFSFEELKGTAFEEWIESHIEEKVVCQFENGKVSRFRIKAYGELAMETRREASTQEDLALGWVNEIEKKGLECLPSDAKLESFLLRAQFFEIYGKKTGAGAESFDEKLVKSAGQWLVPFMAGVNKLTSQIVYDGLYWFLNGGEIDRSVPEQLILETGRKVKVKYEKTGGQQVIRPVVEVIIQRIFGCFSTPKICGAPVVLKLLSPASRPLQITEDLAGFWSGSWIEICKEMKGRYPKHNWDYRIVSD